MIDASVLPPGHVRVYWTRPDRVSPDLCELYGAWLSDEERTRWERFRFDRDRHLYLVAHALLRSTLARQVGTSPDALEFRANDHGRPEILLPRGTGIRFNLSHTHGLVACAVTSDRDVGVDVEGLLREVNLDIAERYFSVPEVAALRRLPKDAATHRFLDLWTLKESYIKARGLGLALPLGGFAFRFEGRALHFEVRPDLNDTSADWWFALCSPIPTHRLALAVRTRGEGITFEAFEVLPETWAAPALPEILAMTPAPAT